MAGKRIEAGQGYRRLTAGKKNDGRPHREDWRGERKDRAAGPDACRMTQAGCKG